MGTIGYLVSTGVIAWVALGVLVFEFLIVVAVSRGRAGLLLPMAANALSGACLILAFHAALTAAGTTQIAVWLALGFMAHLVDTFMRLRR